MVVDDVLGGRESGLVRCVGSGRGRGKGDNNQGAMILATSGPRKLLQIMFDLRLAQTSDMVTTTYFQARGSLRTKLYRYIDYMVQSCV